MNLDQRAGGLLYQAITWTGKNPVEEFCFEEDTADADHSRYVWSNSAYAMATNITRSFKNYGWCANIRGAESGGMIKAAFTAAGQIRREGHVAELDLGDGKSSDLPWTLTVRDAAQPFRLAGRMKSVGVELPTVEEVLKIIK